MQAKDIMKRDVAFVSPVTSIAQLAEILVARGVSAVPVLDDGKVVGMVSEADLLHRHEIGTERDPTERPWWVRLFQGEHSPAGYVESHARHVADIMSSPVVSVSEDTPVAELAMLFETHRIRRVPVVESGRLTGIVGRSDLVRALVSRAGERRPTLSRRDEAIRTALLAELESQPWWRPSQSSVSVSDGIVHYAGLLDSFDESRAARVAAENIPGVRGIEDHRIDAGPTAPAFW